MRAGTLRGRAPRGKAHHEPGAPHRRVVDLHGAAVPFVDGPHHRQAQTGAAAVAAPPLVEAREAVEDPLPLRRWDSRPVVVDDEAHFAVPGGYLHRDAAAAVRAGVVEKIADQ